MSNSVLTQLGAESVFCSWGYDDKRRKIPINPKTGRPALSNKPETFGTLKATEARKLNPAKSGVTEIAGIGIRLGRLSDGRHLVGMDLDSAVDPSTGEPCPWADDALDGWPSYAERSPSGMGFHGLAIVEESDFPAIHAAIENRANRAFKFGPGSHPPGIHLHVEGYYTFTGKAEDDTPLKSIKPKTWAGVIAQGEAQADAYKESGGADDDTMSGQFWNEILRCRHKEMTRAETLEHLQDNHPDLYEYGQAPRSDSDDDQFGRCWRRAGEKIARDGRKAVAGLEDECEGDEPDSGEPPKKRKGPTLKLWTQSERQAFKPPIEFLEGWLAESKFSYIYGPSTAGKSALVLDMAFHVAAGRPWFGKRVRQRPVLYIGLEGESGVLARLEAMEALYGEPSQIDPMTGHWAMLTDKTTTAHVIKAVKELGAGWVIVDTLARAMTGGDENSAQDMGRIIDAAGIIQSVTGAHVTLLHHTGKDSAKGPRGSSALKPAADLEISVEKDPNSPVRVATVLKNKDGKEGDEIKFTIEGQDIDKINSWNEPVNAAVIKSAEGTDLFPDLDASLSDRDRQALEILQQLDRDAMLTEPTESEWADTLKRKAWIEGEPKPDTWSKAYRRTKRKLTDAGLITVSQEGEIHVHA